MAWRIAVNVPEWPLVTFRLKRVSNVQSRVLGEPDSKCDSLTPLIAAVAALHHCALASIGLHRPLRRCVAVRYNSRCHTDGCGSGRSPSGAEAVVAIEPTAATVRARCLARPDLTAMCMR